ncbi:efflux RND transporter periplasmic adaptor subunit [Leptolyngbya sp. PCC 6406]|uniref:efflux RND transporter periplasmic adaptor subunit n=1 Tax=Leptolyngbya sp. PCC 6406 TaxID=1173264 RepID=UPI0002ACC956|nr:efflux RND transporter periplasmic adaptor subunit [Leptolyngbya sp. PCC 6406]
MVADPKPLLVSAPEQEIAETERGLVLPHRPRLPKRLGWLLPLAISPLIGVYLLSDRTLPPPAVTALSVETVTLELSREYVAEREYSGELVASRSSVLGFEAGGTVVSILVQEGDRVSAGQPLARLDTRSLEAQRQQLSAQQDQVQAQLRELQAGPRRENLAAATAAVGDLQQQLALAQLQRDRRADLYTQGAISREELDQQTYNTGALENRLAQAQSQLDELQAGTRSEQLDAQGARVRQLAASLGQVDVDLSKSVLYAPFDGVIQTRALDEGAVVGGGQPVLTLVEAGAREVRIGLPTSVAETLSLGSPQTVRVGDGTFTATLTALLPEVDAVSRTVTAVLSLNAPELTLGQTVRLVLSESQDTDGFWLPATALVPGERGLWGVYVVAESAESAESAEAFTVARREVEVLHTERDRVLVRGTVQAGERAIASGTHRIVPGDAVRVLP